MDSAVTGLYPLHRCKTLHLVRHAQGIHNVEGEKNRDAYLSYDLFDAHLTPLGWQQVSNMRKHGQACGLSKIDHVITSPLLRTLQTAVGVFSGVGYTGGIGTPPLMLANAGNSDHPAISSLICPPSTATELCREHLFEKPEVEKDPEDAHRHKIEVKAAAAAAAVAELEVDDKKEDKHFKLFRELGVAVINRYGSVSFDKPEAEKDPEYAHRHKIEEEAATAAAAVEEPEVDDKKEDKHRKHFKLRSELGVAVANRYGSVSVNLRLLFEKHES